MTSATSEHTDRNTYKKLDLFCGMLVDAVERVRAGGPVVRRQSQDLFFIEATIAELRALFREEARRTNCVWWE